jgi:hypothetical protein
MGPSREMGKKQTHSYESIPNFEEKNNLLTHILSTLTHFWALTQVWGLTDQYI